jgi:hypothetical protein
LLHYGQERSEVSDRVLVKLVREFTSKLDIQQVDLPEILANIHGHLSAIDSSVLANLLKTACDQLVASMASYLLVTHCVLLGCLLRYGVEHPLYTKELADYALRNPHRGSTVIDIFCQLSTRQPHTSPEIIRILKNYGTFSPNNYLKYLLLHSKELADFETLVAEVSKYQLKSVSNSLYN